MASISLKNVRVDYPVFSARGRSIRSELLRHVGGRISKRRGSGFLVEALRGIDLDLPAGSRVAILGPNGSGKSTLLRILGGIMEPTGGEAKVDGRVTTLLDLSMGMDCDATGYENIIMRASFLGATLAEARAIVPKVAEFSELGSYLDLPMSAYSSGMVVRLSFSISTMLCPEILIMDEHVGAADVAFTRKATARIRELADAAEIVVLATHDANLARSLCTRAIVLDRGRIAFDGSVLQASGSYLAAYA